MDQKMFLFMVLVILSFSFIIAAALLPFQIVSYPIKLILCLIGIFFDVLAFSSRYYTFLLMPIFKQRKKNIILDAQEPYWMSGNGDAIIKKVGDEFIATSLVLIPLYRSSTEMSMEEKLDFGKQMGRLVSISMLPVRFSTQLHVLDKDDYIQTIKDNINLNESILQAQIEKNANQTATDNLKGKIAMWRGMLDHFTKVQSLELVLYASVSATGSKEYEATSIVGQRARDLMSGIGTTLGITPSMITGNQMLKFIEPDHLIPFANVQKQINANLSGETIG